VETAGTKIISFDNNRYSASVLDAAVNFLAALNGKFVDFILEKATMWYFNVINHAVRTRVKDLIII
jgi:hypothetical protein